ncbi:hypoxanthine phosphoribosyltransferase [uncultured Limosilactobacillus sp.]|uniref:hypoxanthine phosphoribosyltransferase n=1 Tax=uncultured Limosilactobacillus sp. TaxID=2837629 RepID=UPI0025CF5E75|nr:hypoxanthine phosphoribosyltransferase [uncultured Limosilactobacillus sp.]
MNNDIERVIYDQQEIDQRVQELAEQLNHDYAGKKDVVVVAVLTGAIVFAMDLYKRLDLYAHIDFVDVSSYQGGTSSTGSVKLLHDLKNDIRGKDVIICEDIVDTGRTLKFLIDLLKGRGANSIKICSIFDKPEGRVVNVRADYVGFDVPNEFLVGYGLDYQGLYRNLPYIGVLKPTVYQKKHD